MASLRRGRLWFTAAIAIALYAAASLWPYDWKWPEARQQRVVNAAEPLPGGGVRFPGPGIALVNGSPTWFESAMRSQQVELSLTVRSLAPEQFGPARIFTLSRNPYERNLTIAQEGADLILRLRTPWTDANGTIDGKPVAGVQRLFLTPDWVDLRVSIEPNRLKITVGSKPVVEKALPPRPLETWNPSYRLALGNELTYDRPWLGEIRRAVVRAGDHAKDHADTSRLEFPPTFVITKPFAKLVPLRDLNRADAVQNLVLYVPLGLLLGFLLGSGRGRPRWRIAFGALLLVATVSASMEALQLFVPRRAPSIDDVIFNTLGGGLGLLPALWPDRWLGASVRPSAHGL